MGARSADIRFSFHRVALAMVGQDWMDTIHRKLDPRGRDPCARGVRTSREITGHEASGRDPGRGLPRKALRAIHPPPTSANSAPTTEPTAGNGPEISGAWAAIRTPAHPGKAPDRQTAKETKPAE
jgi:hypothetical protein